MIFDVVLVVVPAVAVVVVVARSRQFVTRFFSASYPLKCTTTALKPRTSHP